MSSVPDTSPTTTIHDDGSVAARRQTPARRHGSATGRAPATHRRTADQGQPLERSRRQPRHHEPSHPDTGRMEHPGRRLRGIHARARPARTTKSPPCEQNSPTRPANAPQLHHQLDAAATAIAALHHDNTLLRQELDQRGRLVTVKGDR